MGAGSHPDVLKRNPSMAKKISDDLDHSPSSEIAGWGAGARLH